MEQQGPREGSMFRLPRGCYEPLESLVRDTDWFEQQVDACRVAISVALARVLKAGKENGDSLETKFSISTLDPDGALRELVLALAPECGDRPYEYAQGLANRGIRLLHNELVEHEKPLPEVLGLHAQAGDSGDS